MSDMLEQAIVDAEALRTAAVKNAETLVLEKYSAQIKDAVHTLLEQDDPLAGLGLGGPYEGSPDPAVGGDSPTNENEEQSLKPSSVMEHIPLAVMDEDDSQIEIPLDELLREIRTINEKMGMEDDDKDVQEEAKDGEDEGDSKEKVDELLDLDEDDFQELEEGHHEEKKMDEEGDLDEGLVNEIIEALNVDVAHDSVKDGYTWTPTSVLELAEEEILALEQDSKVREERSAKNKAIKDLDKVNEAVLRQNEKLQESLTQAGDFIVQLKNAVLTLKERLEHSSLANAKLLYQNKALNSDSLNERQKHKLVESVSHADTIEEAKIIFETLQSTVGSTSRKKQPKSLSEAVEKSSSVILSARNRKESKQGQKDAPVFNRWKFLAGIDNN